jgi:hypothetical protein
MHFLFKKVQCIRFFIVLTFFPFLILPSIYNTSIFKLIQFVSLTLNIIMLSYVPNEYNHVTLFYNFVTTCNNNAILLPCELNGLLIVILGLLIVILLSTKNIKSFLILNFMSTPNLSPCNIFPL